MRPYAVGLQEVVFGLSLKKKAALYRSLATSVSAGISMPRAVELATVELADSVRRDMQEALGEGMPLHEVWMRYPAYFSPFEIAMLQAGELSGDIDGNLLDLANMLEIEQQRYNEMRAQLAYPLVLLHAAVLLPTIPILVHGCLQKYIFTVLCFLIPLYIIAFSVWLLGRLARLSDSIGILMCSFGNIVPIWGKMCRQEAQGHFMECFARLVDSGVLADQSLAVAASSCGNVLLAEKLKHLSEQISGGVKISYAMAQSQLFSAHIVAMMSTGEETGQIGPMASKAANYLLDEAAAQRKSFMSLVPVAVLIFVGIVVGFQVITVFDGYLKSFRDFF